MSTEIERKFLVSGELPDGEDTQIVQGYLSLDPERIVRVRIESGRATITIKGKATGIARPEFEYTIPEPDALQLLALALGQPSEKTRRRIAVGGLTWEVDRFAGANRGLVVAEIELGSASDEFEKPAWVGEEVTHDPHYANANLVLCPFEDWDQRSKTPPSNVSS